MATEKNVNMSDREKRAINDTILLVSNRLGVQPTAVILEFTNLDIENCIYRYMLENNLPQEDRDAVRVVVNKNPHFHGSNSNEMPFEVKVLVDTSKGSFRSKDTNQYRSRIVDRLFSDYIKSGDNRAAVVQLNNAELLNQFCRRFGAKTNKHGDSVRWERYNIGGKGYRGFYVCYLDPAVVQDYFFQANDADSNNGRGLVFNYSQVKNLCKKDSKGREVPTIIRDRNGNAKMLTVRLKGVLSFSKENYRKLNKKVKVSFSSLR